MGEAPPSFLGTLWGTDAPSQGKIVEPLPTLPTDAYLQASRSKGTRPQGPCFEVNRKQFLGPSGELHVSGEEAWRYQLRG